MTILILAVVFAIVFDYIDGFHDSANATTPVVSARVLSPRVAVFLAVGMNFLGAMYSTNVAKTVASGLVNPHDATQAVILAGVMGGIVWNLITKYIGIQAVRRMH